MKNSPSSLEFLSQVSWTSNSVFFRTKRGCFHSLFFQLHLTDHGRAQGWPWKRSLAQEMYVLVIAFSFILFRTFFCSVCLTKRFIFSVWTKPISWAWRRGPSIWGSMMHVMTSKWPRYSLRTTTKWPRGWRQTRNTIQTISGIHISQNHLSLRKPIFTPHID